MLNLWPLHVYVLEVKKLSSYRVDFWVRLIVAALVRIFLAYYLWEALFSETKESTIGGYSFEAMVVYYIVVALVSNMVLANIDRFSSEIYSGTLTRYLLYPVSFYVYQCTAGLAYFTLCTVQLFLGLAVVIMLFGNTTDGFSISISSVALGLFATLIATYCYTIMQSLLELMAFWVEAIFGLMVALYFVTNFLGGGLLPLSLFPPLLREILQYTPFPYLISFPVEVILGRVPSAEIVQGFAVSIMWAIGLTLLASTIWARGLKRYSGVGI